MLKVLFRKKGGVLICDLVGSLDLTSTIRLKNTLLEQMKEGGRHFILNLKEVIYMDSSGLGAILYLLKQSKVNGGDLKVCEAQKDVLGIFEISGINKVLGAHFSREEGRHLVLFKPP